MLVMQVCFVSFAFATGQVRYGYKSYDVRVIVGKISKKISNST